MTHMGQLLYIQTSMKDINTPEFAGKQARKRSRFSCVASERLFAKKLIVAKQLRQHGTRYSAQFMARNHSLSDLQHKLNYIQGCVRSL